jgi:hypothetical protein
MKGQFRANGEKEQVSSWIVHTVQTGPFYERSDTLLGFIPQVKGHRRSDSRRHRAVTEAWLRQSITAPSRFNPSGRQQALASNAPESRRHVIGRTLTTGVPPP